MLRRKGTKQAAMEGYQMSKITETDLEVIQQNLEYLLSDSGEAIPVPSLEEIRQELEDFGGAKIHPRCQYLIERIAGEVIKGY